MWIFWLIPPILVLLGAEPLWFELYDLLIKNDDPIKEGTQKARLTKECKVSESFYLDLFCLIEVVAIAIDKAVEVPDA